MGTYSLKVVTPDGCAFDGQAARLVVVCLEQVVCDSGCGLWADAGKPAKLVEQPLKRAAVVDGGVHLT